MALRETSRTGRVVGIDAAGKYGWVGVVLDAKGFEAAGLGTLRQIIDRTSSAMELDEANFGVLARIRGEL